MLLQSGQAVAGSPKLIFSSQYIQGDCIRLQTFVRRSHLSFLLSGIFGNLMFSKWIQGHLTS